MNTKNSIIIVFLILFIGLMIGLNSCQKGNDSESRVIARINGFEITYKDFKEQFSRLHPKKELDNVDQDLKQAVLEEMIDQQLILMEAYRLKYDKEAETLELLEIKERELAANALLSQFKVSEKITDEVLEKYYQWLGKNYDLSIITLKTTLFDENKAEIKKKADSIFAKIKTGANFKALAAEYSDHSSAKIDSGSLRKVSCFDLDEAIIEQAYEMKKGEISEPFYSNNAYYIIKVDKIYPQEKQSFENEKELLIEDVERYLKNINSQITSNMNSYLKSVYHYQVFSENINFFCKRTKRMTAREDTAGLFNPEEKDIVLSKTDFEEINISQFLTKVVGYYWDSLNQERVVLMLLDYMNSRRLIKDKAMEMKLNESQQVQKNLSVWFAAYLKSIVVKKQVLDKIEKSDAILLPLYHHEKRNLTVPKMITVREIFCKTKERIERVHKLAISNDDFEMLEKKYNQNQETRTHGLLGPFSKGRHGKLGELAFSGMNVNDISKPFRYRGGYSIFKIVAIEESHVKSFQEAKEELKDKYIKENHERLVSEWLNNKVRKNSDIQIIEASL